jgi:hypothetical protein
MIRHVADRLDHLHAVKFYDTPASLCRTVAEFIGAGLNSGEPALVIATAEHTAAILNRLDSRGLNTPRLQQEGSLVLLDAAKTLALFMVDGMPHPARFSEVAVSALAQLWDGRPDSTVRAYGEMVDVLWKQGQDVAAIRLEMLWNKLAFTNDFSLLCGYSMGNFYKDAGRCAIHHQHTHVISEHGEFVRVPQPGVTNALPR